MLILDCWNPHLSEHEREMICRLYDLADAQKARGFQISVRRYCARFATVS